MGSVLSENEREALSRFLSKVIEDVENVSKLFESRGADASLPREAQAKLKKTLDNLQRAEHPEITARMPGVKVAGGACLR